MIHAETIASALGGKRSGRGWIVPCVAHDDRSPSLSIADGENGKLLVKCFAGCNARDVLAALRRLGLFDATGAGMPRGFNGKRKAPDTASGDAPLDWSARADRIWRAAVPIIGTPAENYLRSRRCLIPNCADLRFLRARGAMRYPAMLARVTDALTGQPLTLHFTLLLSDGSGKAQVDRPKLLLKGHRKSGGVIRLTDDNNVTMGLGLTEGIENALICMASGWRSLWAAVDAGNIANFPILPGIECLTVFADHDKAGLTAAQRCAERWQAAGRDVRIVMPSAAGNDWADVAKSAAL